jgi:hypothetical protein
MDSSRSGARDRGDARRVFEWWRPGDLADHECTGDVALECGDDHHHHDHHHDPDDPAGTRNGVDAGSLRASALTLERPAGVTNLMAEYD